MHCLSTPAVRSRRERDRLIVLMASSSSSGAMSVGMVLFPNVTQLDVTGPYEVFARMPATKVHLVAATLAPIRSEHGLRIVPDVTFDTVPPLDVICVPGGMGVNVAMEDEALLEFLQLQARDARYVTSVCTGALILGAAGLLRGYRATTHWLSLDLLPLFGAHPVDQRIVIDRNRITSRCVRAGIDLGLIIASELCGAAVAQEIRLMIEYNPAPRYTGGSPGVRPADLVQRVVQTRQPVQSDRRIVAERVGARLDHGAGGSTGRLRMGFSEDRTPWRIWRATEPGAGRCMCLRSSASKAPAPTECPIRRVRNTPRWSASL